MVNTTTILQCTYYSKELEEYLHLTYEHHWEEKFTDVIFYYYWIYKRNIFDFGNKHSMKKKTLIQPTHAENN